MAHLFREHAVFRYASIVAWLTGGFLLWRRGWLIDAFTLTSYHAVIGMGAWIGTIMMLNVWFVLWPNQAQPQASRASDQFGSRLPAGSQRPCRRRSARPLLRRLLYSGVYKSDPALRMEFMQMTQLK